MNSFIPPDCFVWTRIGTEAGEETRAIIVRKEAERRANDGLFLWGIGSALGQSVARLMERGAHQNVLFSPIAGRPQKKDVSPDALVAWRAYTDRHGRHPMPKGTLVTSRYSGRYARPHYALFCHRREPLRLAVAGTINAQMLRNLTTGAPVGASQNTAVVEFACDAGERPYDVLMTARLEAPYYAILDDPVVIPVDTIPSADTIEAMSTACWLTTIEEILANSAWQYSLQTQGHLF